jgi:hypothetical protein
MDPEVVLSTQANEAATAAWCERVRALIAEGRTVSCDVQQLTGSAAEVINALARLQLTALGCGGRIRLRHADPALLALLDLAGLANLFDVGEPEEGEQLGL